MSEVLECLDEGRGVCRGPVEYRMALSATGRGYPRCARHWDERLDQEEELRRRYPEIAPPDFDPMAAGERWEEDF